jgi:DNA replication protein DnaC
MIAVFAGGCGTGKGHLAWSIARALAQTRGVVTKVVVLSDVIRDLREAWNPRDDGPSEAERLGKYRAAELLVIDEVSRHAFFGQPVQHLYDLVAWREVQMRPTILTTNELGDDLVTVLGPALASRAAGWNGFVDFGQADYRLTHRIIASLAHRKAVRLT